MLLNRPETIAGIERISSRNLSQTVPSDAIREIYTQGPVVQARGSNRHVAGPPSDVRQASAANVARAKVFEVSMNTRGPLVLASAIPGASYDVVAVEAHSCQLFFEDPADVCPLLGRAMDDVC